MNMSYNPYQSFEPHAFWKNGVENSDITFPENIYNPKWKISDSDNIATMGSCFAQHIAKWLRENGFNVPFYESEGVKETEKAFSANYGNVYTIRQALQLIQESVGYRVPSEVVWGHGDKFVDALRPNSIKDGFNTIDDVLSARKTHLKSVKKMVENFDVLIFTLGLTEAWEIKKCGTILPTAPGVIAGNFNPERYQFLNFNYNDVLQDLNSFCELLKTIRNGKPFKLVLTVSPVPLTATATDQHILLASTYSKAVLRSVAGDFVLQNDFAAYFPSFEIVNNPAAKGDFFESNLRSVKPSAVANVMNVFSTLALENPRMIPQIKDDKFDPDCEDALLEEFSKENHDISFKSIDMVYVGESHLTGLRPIVSGKSNKSTYFFPTNWGQNNWKEFDKNNYLTKFTVKPEYSHLIENASIKENETLILIGLGFGGDDIIRCHGNMGRDSSPKVPIIKSDNREFIEFYKSVIKSKLDVVKQLDSYSPYKKIFWIFGPDMCVDVAVNRLGEKFVNSGSYLHHKKAYLIAFYDCVPSFNKIEFILHDTELCDPKNGFTLNEYKASDNPFDIHCNSEYYKSCVSKILSTG